MTGYEVSQYLDMYIKNGEFFWNRAMDREELNDIFREIGIFPLRIREVRLSCQGEHVGLEGMTDIQGRRQHFPVYFSLSLAAGKEALSWSVRLLLSGQTVSMDELFGGIPCKYEAGNVFSDILVERAEMVRQQGKKEGTLPYQITGTLSLRRGGKFSLYPLPAQVPLSFSGRLSPPFSLCRTHTSSLFDILVPVSGGVVMQLPGYMASPPWMRGSVLRLRLLCAEYMEDGWIQTDSGIYLETELAIPGAGTPVVCSMPLFSDSRIQVLTARFENGLSASGLIGILAAIFSLGEQTRVLVLPQGLPVLDYFKLFSVECYLVREQGTWGEKVVAVRTNVAGVKPYTPPIPFMTIERLVFAVEAAWGETLYEHHKAQTDIQAAVSGKIRIRLSDTLDLTVQVAGYYPQYRLEGRISLEPSGHRQEPYTFREIAEGVGVWLDQDLALAWAGVVVDVRQRYFELSVGVKDVWQISVGHMTIDIKSITASLLVAHEWFKAELEGEFALAAGRNEKTVFAVRAEYENKVWVLEGGIAQGTLDLGNLMTAFFSPAYVPDEDPVWGIKLEQLWIRLSKGQETSLYVRARLSASWKLSLFRRDFLICAGVEYQMNEKDKILNLTGEIQFGAFDIRLTVQNITQQERSYLFRVQWENAWLQMTYGTAGVGKEIHDLLSLELGGTSIGALIELIGSRINPNGEFHLTGAFQVLEEIRLSRFRLTMDMTAQTLCFLYRVDLNLAGLLYVDEIGLCYDTGKSQEALRIVITGTFLEKTYGTEAPLSWDLMNEEPPQASGGKKYHLTFLGLGQHITCPGLMGTEGIQDALSAMKTEMKTEKFPTYSGENGFLFGAEAMLAGCIRAQLVLNDPLLYGLRLVITKSDCGSVLERFNGLELTLLYRKISPSIGMFQVTLVMPERYRSFRLGDFLFTLGEMSLSVYTNGNFQIDLGFPHQRDFSRSFVIAAGQYIGRGGIYFGILNSATSDQVPDISNGVFEPVMTVGLGLSLGIGKSFDFGIVKGGLFLELVGIFEGVFASFCPYDQTAPKASYYHMEAVVGLVGRLWLTADLKIIAISASLEISAFVAVSIESCRPMELSLDLALTLKAYIKILFIKIRFSFSFKYHFTMSIGRRQETPWVLAGEVSNRMAVLHAAAVRPDINERIFSSLDAGMPRQNIKGRVPVVNLSLCLAPGLDLGAENTGFLAVIPFISKMDGSFKNLVSAHVDWFVEHAAVGGVIYAEEYRALQNDFKAEITYERLKRLWEGRLDFVVSLEERTEGEEESRVFFPLFPELRLTLEMDGRPICCVDYDSDTQVGEEYLEQVRRYFEKLMERELGRKGGMVRSSTGKIAFTSLVMEEYITCLFKTVAANIAVLFHEFRYDGAGLTLNEAADRFGIGEVLLSENPGLVFREGSILSLQDYWYDNRCESPGRLCRELPLSWAELWEAIGGNLHLAACGSTFTMPRIQASNPRSMTLRPLSAFYFVRYFGAEAVGGTEDYIEDIIKNNEVEPDYYECREHGRLFDLNIRGKVCSYEAVRGDTLERIGAMNRLLDEVPGSRAEFEAFYRECGGGSGDGDIPAGIQLPEKTLVIWERSLQELTDRLLVRPDVWNQEGMRDCNILTLHAMLRIPAVSFPVGGKSLADTAGALGLTYAQIFEAAAGMTEPFTTTLYEIRNALRLDAEWLEEILIEEERLDEYGGMLSRMFLQGLRLPGETGEESRPLFELLRQIIPYDSIEDHKPVTGELRTGECAFCRIGAARAKWMKSSWENCFPQEPYVRHFQLEPGMAPYFSRAARVYNSAESMQILTPSGSMRVYWMGEDFAQGARKGGAYELLGGGGSEPENGWACVLPVTIKASDFGYVMYGVKPKDRDLLYALSRMQDLNISFAYGSSPVQGRQKTCFGDEAVPSEIVLIRQNLSRITHSSFDGVRALGNEEKEYIASAADPEFLTLLWECSVVQGGYYFSYRTRSGEGIPEEIFLEDKTALLYLLVRQNPSVRGIPWVYPGCFLSVILSGKAQEETIALRAVGNDSGDMQMFHLLEAGMESICFALQEEQEPEYGSLEYRRWLTGEYYHIAAYRIIENKGFSGSNWSYPLIPVENGPYLRFYQANLPLYRFAKEARGEEGRNTGENHVQDVYRGVGEDALIELVFGDIYGNREQKGRILTIPCRYHDPLESLHAIPYIVTEFDVEEREQGGRQFLSVGLDEGIYRRQEGEQEKKVCGIIGQYRRQETVFTFASGLSEKEYAMEKGRVLEFLARERDLLTCLRLAEPVYAKAATPGEAVLKLNGSYRELSAPGISIRHLFQSYDGLTVPDTVTVGFGDTLREIRGGRELEENLNLDYPLRMHSGLITVPGTFVTEKGENSFQAAAAKRGMPLKELLEDNWRREGILASGFCFTFMEQQTRTWETDSLETVCSRLEKCLGKTVPVETLIAEPVNQACLGEQRELAFHVVYAQKGDTLSHNSTGLRFQDFISLNDGVVNLLEPGGLLYLKDRRGLGSVVEMEMCDAAVHYQISEPVLWELFQDESLAEGVCLKMGERFCLSSQLPDMEYKPVMYWEYCETGYSMRDLGTAFVQCNYHTAGILSNSDLKLDGDSYEVRECETVNSLLLRLSERLQTDEEHVIRRLWDIPIFKTEFWALKPIERELFYFPMEFRDGVLLRAEARVTVKRTGNVYKDAPEDVSLVYNTIPARMSEKGRGFPEHIAAYPGLHAAADDHGNIMVLQMGEKGIRGIRVSAERLWYASLKPLNLEKISRKEVPLSCLKEDGSLEEGGTADFSDVDLEDWAVEFLEDMEHLLGSSIVHKAEMENRPYISRIIGIKELLAGTLSSQLTGMTDEALPEGLLPIMQTLLKNTLLDSLSAGYDGGVWLGMKAYASSQERIRLSLDVICEDPEVGETLWDKIDTSSAKYLVSKISPQRREITSLTPSFHCQINEMEYDIRERVDGYESSRWLRLFKPLEDPCVSLDLTPPAEIPVVLRHCPGLPVCVHQKPVYENQKCGGITGHFLWNYETIYEFAPAMQDCVVVTVDFMPEPRLRGTKSSADLFTELAGYHNVRKKLWEMLEGENTEALVSFCGLAGRIAQSWGEWTTKTVRTVVGKQLTMKLRFDYRYERLRFQLQTEPSGEQELYFSYIGTEGEIFFRKQDGYYELDGDMKAAPGEKIRFKVGLRGLNVSSVYSARASCQMIRNELFIGNHRVGREFIYRGERVDFPNSLYAGHRCRERILLGKMDPSGESGMAEGLVYLLQKSGLPLDSGKLPYEIGIEYNYQAFPGALMVGIPIAAFAMSRPNERIWESLRQVFSEWIQESCLKFSKGEVHVTITFMDPNLEKVVLSFEELYVEL